MTRYDGPGQQESDHLFIEASVFEVDTSHMTLYPNGDALPSINVTSPLLDEDGQYLGRISMASYPYEDPEDPYSDDDPNGDDALFYGGTYYEEGMACTDPRDHDRRVDCFRAAEVFYRHSAGKENAVANLCLGYTYSYDRCEGRYWPESAANKPDGIDSRPYPRQERAFECFLVAAKADIPEACYKLGDLYKHGAGCQPSAKNAFTCYAHASEIAASEHPVILGSIALRLASCYEDGFGCELDFERALKWYQEAVAGLQVAVDNGDSWYEKALAEAQAGVKRCKQEIA